MSAVQKIADDVQRFLHLSHRPVGIRIEEGPRRTEPSRAPLRFCILERDDLSSGTHTFAFGDIECPGASLALGLVEPQYLDVQPRIRASVSGVVVGPAEDADQVVFVVTPRQAMILAVLTGGINAHCTGTHALCGEVIARVHETGRPHLSLLCPGMRDFCGFREEEMVVGISWEDFVTLPDAMSQHASLQAGAAGGRRSVGSGELRHQKCADRR